MSDSDVKECAPVQKKVPGKAKKRKVTKNKPEPAVEADDVSKSGHSADSADDGEDAKDASKRKSKKSQLDYRARLMKTRQEKNIWLLSKKEEDKLYRIKKGMRKKGASEDEIKQEVRVVRRKMELGMKKTDKQCFKCRRMGHMAVDCPNDQKPNKKTSRKGRNDDLIGDQGDAKICYRCGSTEHSLWQCSKEGEDLPFASCYICRKQGHLSRECPENTRGVYPKGGACKQCGSVNHLVKDCPDRVDKKEDVKLEVLALTIDSARPADEEVFEPALKVAIPKVKSAKIVKF